jgi:hypothetical protein
MTPPHSHPTSASRSGPQVSAPADAPYSVVRVKGSAGPVKGELEVTSSETQGSPVSTAIAILVLVTAAALAAVAVSIAGWLAGFPAVATGLGACGAFALIFGAGLYITYWRAQPGARHKTPR